MDTDTPDFDMDAGVAEIAEGLGLSPEEPENPDTPDIQPELPETPETPEAPEVPEAQVKPAPKSWPKEMHEHWTKTPPQVQEYWEKREAQMLEGLEQYRGDATLGKSLKEVILPYQPMLQASGVDETKAVQFLLNAHYRLTNGSPEQRQAAYQQLGQNLGLVQAQEQQQIDPALRAVMERQQKLESALEQRQREAFEAKRGELTSHVAAFADAKDEKGNPKHPYFDEVADDIILLINAGHELDAAYDKAVYANPVTRQKELARLQKENEAKLREKADAEAKAARRASSSNVRSRDTRKAPTEPLGKMDDTMRDTLKEIRERTH
jgi:hypothetical protein